MGDDSLTAELYSGLVLLTQVVFEFFMHFSNHHFFSPNGCCFFLSFGRGIELERQGASSQLHSTSLTSSDLLCPGAPGGGLSLWLGFLGRGSKQRVQKL